MYVGTLYKMTDLSTKSVLTLVNATVLTGMALVSFLFRSAKTITCCLSEFAFGNGTRISIAGNMGGSAPGNRRSCF